ncbi:MAG: 5'-nucleotidase SurE [Chloroflexi bacterium]|nr:5'-nucleotidase SurE [Chloroflexota bacterium]MBT9165867.1 5'-nucleotidase SurE [Chloroflexota bacterium]
MKILVSNDDGIYARGLWALVKELKGVGDVVVVAPDRQQSAAGTSVTLHYPLRVKKVKPRLSGTLLNINLPPSSRSFVPRMSERALIAT